jgi:hypothetical protein
MSAQSASELHPCPIVHRASQVPPQSTPVSSPFAMPSSQAGSVTESPPAPEAVAPLPPVFPAAVPAAAVLVAPEPSLADERPPVDTSRYPPVLPSVALCALSEPALLLASGSVLDSPGRAHCAKATADIESQYTLSLQDLTPYLHAAGGRSAGPCSR